MVLFPSATGLLFADLSFDPYLDLGPWLFHFLFPLYALLAWVFPVLLRPLFWLVTHALYRFSVYHRVHIPVAGPALVVCNHVTYLDWLLLWIASPRPLRFVIWTGFYRNPVLRFVLSYGRHHTILSELDLRLAAATGRPWLATTTGDDAVATDDW